MCEYNAAYAQTQFVSRGSLFTNIWLQTIRSLRSYHVRTFCHDHFTKFGWEWNKISIEDELIERVTGFQCSIQMRRLLKIWYSSKNHLNPDSKFHWGHHEAHLGRQDPGGPHVGHMNFAIWEHIEDERKQTILKKTFSNVFSWMKMYRSPLKFHWILFPRVQLTLFLHWFR